MPSWVVTEPELGLELYCAFVGASILRIVITHVLWTSGAEQANGFLPQSPFFVIPACASESGGAQILFSW